MDNDLLDALEDLGYDGPLMEEGALTKAAEGDQLTQEFMTLCVWLSDNLKTVCKLGETLSEKEDQETFRIEMSGLLKELGCPHSQLSGVNGLSTTPNRLLLLDYLTSELQACRILGGVEEENMEIDAQAVSPPLQQLKLILAALELPMPTKDSTVFDLFSQTEAKIRQLLNKLKKEHLGKPLLTKRLSKKQWAKVDSINGQLNSEYTLRRQMLLKRLDVTVQSFGWSDKAKHKKDQMAAAFQPIRRMLPVSAPVSVADILSARSDLLKQPRTSSEEFRAKTACAINKVLMGKVPDRGGRTLGMQAPPPEMPSFKKRVEQPRDQRPGSARGGRGGHGGRGGKVQGGWQGGGGGGGNRGGWSRGRGGRQQGGGNLFGGGSGYQQDRSVYYS